MNFDVLTDNELQKEKERLNALYRYDILDTEQEEVYNKIADVASYICGTPVSLITLIDADRQWFKSHKGLDITELPREISFCNHAIKTDHLMEVPDMLLDTRFNNNPLVVNDPGVRFYAGSPLVTSDGYKLGTLCVLDNKPRSLTEEQKNCLTTLAEQIVAQMELKRQKEQLQKLNINLIDELESKLEDRNKVLQLFTRFVPDEIVSKHLASEDLKIDDAELKNLTVLFCDIRGYTSIVEKITPGKAVEILNKYYSIMSDVISTYSGMVNQYVGDEIFATFGAPFSFPPYERNAVFCAIEMMKKLNELNVECQQYATCDIKLGIGIHSGEVITGTLGSRNKIEYSVTGDTVNTGKRIETLTQDQPNTILISNIVYDKIKDEIEVKHWPPMAVKGKSEPLRIYEVKGKK
ncbi:MAG TPA: adenylate/guanylate cyclase domain-containing protein [Flavisolibacter sp.]|nr:adenylate/guanylate cyclase domain-containing protein [Flavisolibacter sp.]